MQKLIIGTLAVLALAGVVLAGHMQKQVAQAEQGCHNISRGIDGRSWTECR